MSHVDPVTFLDDNSAELARLRREIASAWAAHDRLQGIAEDIGGECIAAQRLIREVVNRGGIQPQSMIALCHSLKHLDKIERMSEGEDVINESVKPDTSKKNRSTESR